MRTVHDGRRLSRRRARVRGPPSTARDHASPPLYFPWTCVIPSYFPWTCVIPSLLPVVMCHPLLLPLAVEREGKTLWPLNATWPPSMPRGHVPSPPHPSAPPMPRVRVSYSTREWQWDSWPRLGTHAPVVAAAWHGPPPLSPDPSLRTLIVALQVHDISSYLPISPHISPHLPTSPHISPQTSLHISPLPPSALPTTPICRAGRGERAHHARGQARQRPRGGKPRVGICRTRRRVASGAVADACGGGGKGVHCGAQLGAVGGGARAPRMCKQHTNTAPIAHIQQHHRTQHTYTYNNTAPIAATPATRALATKPPSTRHHPPRACHDARACPACPLPTDSSLAAPPPRACSLTAPRRRLEWPQA